VASTSVRVLVGLVAAVGFVVGDFVALIAIIRFQLKALFVRWFVKQI